ncbi:hypothetical protein OUO06_09440 [Photobacterium damselae]|uniref:hypothetical protein n=1 Tax=Photobacterium damselae TaxID=38293 RepID=UPI003C6DC21E
MNKDSKIAHLGFVQNVIARMGQNSFYLKGWCVTLLAALFALSSKDSHVEFALVVYFPLFMFWVLDAYFLYQERNYRQLYIEIATDIRLSDTFSLDVSLNSKQHSFTGAFFSRTLFPFYMLIVVLVLFIMFGVLK